MHPYGGTCWMVEVVSYPFRRICTPATTAILFARNVTYPYPSCVVIPSPIGNGRTPTGIPQARKSRISCTMNSLTGGRAICHFSSPVGCVAELADQPGRIHRSECHFRAAAGGGGAVVQGR